MMPTPRFHPRAFSCLLLLAGLCTPSGAWAQLTATPSLTWTSAGFKKAIGDDQVAHVSELLLHDDGSRGRAILAAYYGRTGGAKLAISTNDGASWAVQAIPGLTQVRTMVPLHDGSILIGGSVDDRTSPLVRLRRVTLSDWSVTEWLSCGTGSAGLTLPLRTATTVWDIQVNAWGDAFIAAGAEDNDPARPNVVVFRTTDGCETLMPAAEIATQSVLALAVDSRNRLYAATADTTEHDDPTLAGQTRIFYSDDHGSRWTETGRPAGAAKVYHLAIKADGTLLAGTGIRGGLYSSRDGGVTWTEGTPIPSADRIRGDGSTATGEVTRIYRILELDRQWILVGTGNDLGDLWLSPNNGVTWFRTTQASGDSSNVSWTIAKAPDGTLWIGKGSTNAEIYRASFVPPIWTAK